METQEIVNLLYNSSNGESNFATKNGCYRQSTSRK